MYTYLCVHQYLFINVHMNMYVHTYHGMDQRSDLSTQIHDIQRMLHAMVVHESTMIQRFTTNTSDLIFQITGQVEKGSRMMQIVRILCFQKQTCTKTLPTEFKTTQGKLHVAHAGPTHASVSNVSCPQGHINELSQPLSSPHCRC